MALVVFEGKVHMQTQYIAVYRWKNDEIKLISGYESESKKSKSVDDIPWFGY